MPGIVYCSTMKDRTIDLMKKGLRLGGVGGVGVGVGSND